MRGQFVKILRQNRFLFLFLTFVTVYTEAGFLIASVKNDINEMKMHMIVTAFLACVSIAAFSAAALIQYAREADKAEWKFNACSRSLTWTAAFFLFSFLTGLAFFLLCRLHVMKLSVVPDTVTEMKGIMAYLLLFYTGLEITVTAGNSVLVFALFALSAFSVLGNYALMDTIMKRIGIRRRSRILYQIVFFVSVCFIIRHIWPLRTMLPVKTLMMLLLGASLFLANRFLLTKKQKTEV